jgi:predicted PurR-regulated permease PerM
MSETIAAPGGAPEPEAEQQDPPPRAAPGHDPPGSVDPLLAAETYTPRVPPVVVPRWVQLVLLPLALLAMYELARAAGTVLLIALFASLAALIFNPLVSRLHRLGIPRGLGIPIVYLGALLVVLAVIAGLSAPITSQLSTFQANVPSLVRKANHELVSIQNFLNHHGLKVHIAKQGQTALQTVQHEILKRSGAILSFSRDVLAKVATILFDLVLTLVLSIYMLVYSREIGALVRRIVPAGDGTPADDFPTLIQRAVSGYVRGQLLFSLIMGASAAICMWIMGVTGIFSDGQTYAVFFGGFYGLMEMIPYVGPIIGPAPAVAVALFDHPLTALWVLLVFVALQQLEGHVVAPQLFRISLRINPIVIILALLVGDQIYGIPGALLALPIASVARETILYLRKHLVFEPWAVTSPPLLGGSAVAPCRACGAPPGPSDSFCRNCGSPLTTVPRP